MKRQYLTLGAVCLLACAFLCAFTFLQGTHYHNQKQSLNLQYIAAEQKDDVLTLSIEIDSAFPFEIANNPVVSTQDSFETQLKFIECRREGNRYLFLYAMEEDKAEVYIKSPALYFFESIPEVSVPLSVGETAKIEEGGWFCIKNIDIIQYGEGVYCVKVSVEAENDMLPRFPRIVLLDGTTIGGLASLAFDDSQRFIDGEFCYLITAKTSEEVISCIRNATLIVSEGLVKADPDNTYVKLVIESQ